MDEGARGFEGSEKGLEASRAARRLVTPPTPTILPKQQNTKGQAETFPASRAHTQTELHQAHAWPKSEGRCMHSGQW